MVDHCATPRGTDHTDSPWCIPRRVACRHQRESLTSACSGERVATWHARLFEYLKLVGVRPVRTKDAAPPRPCETVLFEREVRGFFHNQLNNGHVEKTKISTDHYDRVALKKANESIGRPYGQGLPVLANSYCSDTSVLHLRGLHPEIKSYNLHYPTHLRLPTMRWQYRYEGNFH